MKLDNICTNCMQGILRDGYCTSCGHPEQSRDEHSNRFLLPRSYLKKDRYVIGRVLGYGGFGNTYIAYDRSENQRIAIKECYPEYAVERNNFSFHLMAQHGYEEEFERLKKSFYNEANLILKLSYSSKDTLKIYDLFHEYGTVYYTMEYLDGMDITHYMKKCGIMDWEEASRVVEKTLYYLQILHSNNMIHRDISPNNIFLVRNGELKLLDFGSASDMSSNSFSTTGSRVFSPPEIWDCYKKQGPWTDLYSFGAVLYYVLTGKLPKGCRERIDSIKAKGLDCYIPVKKRNADIPDHVAKAIDRSMRLESEKRFQSVKEFSVALLGKKKKNWFLVCTKGAKKGQRFSLGKNELFGIGRIEENAIVYRNGTPWVSGRHCSLFVDEEDQVYVRDENSKNHTFVNDYQLDSKSWYQFSLGDVLKFTSEEYILEEETELE